MDWFSRIAVQSTRDNAPVSNGPWDRIVECQVCVMLNQIDLLERDCDDFDDGAPNGSCDDFAAGNALARVITDSADLIGGPLARGRLGDIYMANDAIRVIIQKPGRDFSGFSTRTCTVNPLCSLASSTWSLPALGLPAMTRFVPARSNLPCCAQAVTWFSWLIISAPG